MARRSLQASILGIEKAKRAFKRKEWTQEYLAGEVGIETRQPIWKFFTGKPIERHIFMEICFKLDLDWEEVAALPTESPLTAKEQDHDLRWDIDALVQVVRSRRRDKIQAQCATLRLLDIAQTIDLEDVYVSVNFLKNITSQRWLNIFELQGFNPKEFDHFGLHQFCNERVPAMQAITTYPKLVVLGKPGAGKTTLLQHIATQCTQGKLLIDRIPIFIRLKNFAANARETGDFSLLSYIIQELGFSGVSDQQVKTLLHQGRALILLDGLDEIQDDDSAEIMKRLRYLFEEYYKNQFIITCRIATQQYLFEGFTEIEIADLDQSQIEAFVQKWFVTVGRNSREKGKVLATQFIQKLQLSENRQIREIAVTPLLLNLACCVFQIRSDFPARGAELYKQGLEILLNRWDQARSIKRAQFHGHLSLTHQIKLLSQIAAITFKQGHYFFTQSNAQQYITDYLRNLPNAQTDPEVLQFNSEAVLKSLEAHGLLVEQARGVYSLSHLTFQEYLTARNIVASPESQILEEKLINLVSHVTEPRWRQVFLLTAAMLGNAAYLLQLMKQHIDKLMTFDQQLQQFLIWLNQKCLSVQAPYKSAAIRAFYLTLVLPRDLTLARDLTLSLAIDPRLAANVAPDLAIDLTLYRVLSLSKAKPSDPVERVFALSFALPDDRVLVCYPGLQPSLQQLKEQLPAPNQAKERLKEWWNANGGTWAEKLRCVMLQYRNIGYQWQFSEQQKEVIKQYYAANQLLMDCLKTGAEVTPTLRAQIEETLLLPLARASGGLGASGNYRTDSYIR